MEKDKIKEFKQTRLIIVLVAIIIVLVFALGFVLGTKNNKILINPDTTKEIKETKKEKEEIVKDSKPEEDKKIEKIDDELAKKAYEIIPKGYGLAEGFYQGKKIDLTTINSEYKFAWLLSTMPKKYDIPVCSDKYLELTQEELKNNSIFEDNSFIEEEAKKGLNEKKDYSEKDVYISNFWKYEKGKFFVNNTNCDGRGTGPQDFEEFAYDSYKKEDNELYINVRFAYFKPVFPDNWDGIEQLKYDIYDSYEEKANLIYKEYDVRDFEFDLDDKNSVIYQFTFKIDGEKLYPLTVEMK